MPGCNAQILPPYISIFPLCGAIVYCPHNSGLGKIPQRLRFGSTVKTKAAKARSDHPSLGPQGHSCWWGQPLVCERDEAPLTGTSPTGWRRDVPTSSRRWDSRATLKSPVLRASVRAAGLCTRGCALRARRRSALRGCSLPRPSLCLVTSPPWGSSKEYRRPFLLH